MKHPYFNVTIYIRNNLEDLVSCSKWILLVNLNYVFKLDSEAYLEPIRTSTTELFCEDS